ncbi:helix-turn-helix transcriptional regulator [Streptantibioticus parmotrematis]|uniref:helix-turn-helix transcriptional regulator n=1 Tax=Streptantibioticus parmotrematis TaxID=2873249 RepID=UPI0027DFA30F|nr:LuxR C-terminal-related transcriptional regulator [Streptantibioticus parmotrematis]
MAGGPVTGAAGPTGDDAGGSAAHWRREAAAWHNRFIMLLDRSPVPIAIADTEGVISGVNPPFAALWGLRPGQLRERRLLDLFDPQDHDRLRRLAEALRTGRRSRYHLPVRWQGTGGTPGTGQLTVEPVGGDTQNAPALLVTLREEEPPRALPGPPPGMDLGEREAEVVALVASGATTAAIARELDLTVDGVNYHLGRLSRRLQAPNRAALVARAYVLGLLDPASWPPRARAHEPERD